jgi:hypothetical protein
LKTPLAALALMLALALALAAILGLDALGLPY